MNKTNSQNETPNYGLHLPSEDDFYDVNIKNENSTKIDQAIKQEAEAAKKYTDDAVKNVKFEVIDSVTSTDKTRAGSANAVKMAFDKGVAGQQFKLTGNDGKVKPTTAFTSFDDITEPGFYYAGGTITAGKPTGFNAGLLIVNRLTEAPGISQMLVNYLDNKMWIRYFDGTSWSAWTEQASVNYVDSNFTKASEVLNSNILPNSSALVGLNGWTTLGTAVGWTANKDAVTGGAFVYSGSVANGVFTVLESTPIRVNSGGTHQLQAMFYSVNSLMGLIYVEVCDVVGNVIVNLPADYQKTWHRKFIDFTVPSDVSTVKVRVAMTNVPAGFKAISRIKLCQTSGPKDVPYSNEADTSLLVNYVDSLPWQRSKMTSDDGTATAITGQDLNTTRSTGFYMGSNLTNAPDNNTVDWWYIEQIAHNDGYIIQHAYPLSNGSIANGMRQRRKINGNWQPWSEDLFQSGVNAKQGTVDAINAMGGNASTNDTWVTLHTKIRALKTAMKVTRITGLNQAINKGAFEIERTFGGLTFKPVMIEVIASNSIYISTSWGSGTNKIRGILRADCVHGTVYYGESTQDSNYTVDGYAYLVTMGWGTASFTDNSVSVVVRGRNYVTNGNWDSYTNNFRMDEVHIYGY